MLSRQTTRTIFRWAIFFIVLLGLPLGFFAFFIYGTVCIIDPFFYIQRVGILFGEILGINEGPGFSSDINLILITVTVGPCLPFLEN
jgi:hypothetical protein